MELAPGLTFKNYLLERKLGTGASAEVWRASDGAKTVALKILNEDLLERPDAEKHYRRLEYEINALERLKHAYVPAVYAYDLGYQRPYFAMQYVEGEPYDRLIASGAIFKIDLMQRFEAICKIALTLSEAHHLGIIHRDIKPANLKGFDPPYLLDFGIALDETEARSAPPDVGTGIYMPPAGEPIDKLSDIFSFGLVIYEILFGQHAIFTPETIDRTVAGTRQRAAEFLRNENWRIPSRIPVEALPPDLQRLDLTKLDAVFGKIFGSRATRYTEFIPLLADLEDALNAVRPEAQNGQFVPAAFEVQPIPMGEHFTAQEVDNGGQASDVPPTPHADQSAVVVASSQGEVSSLRLGALAVSILAAMVFLVWKTRGFRSVSPAHLIRTKRNFR